MTGARRGIGFAIATALLERGASVVVGGRDPAQFGDLHRRLDQIAPGRVYGCAADLTTGAGRATLIAAAPRINILVNNAGGFTNVVDTLTSTEDEWNEQLHLNLTVPFLLCQAVLPQMIDRRWGRIINIGSVVAAAPQLGNAIGYVAAKSGLVGFTRQLAAEVAAHGVTANVINPGTIKTEHLGEYFDASGVSEESLASGIAVGRLGRPGEIAAMVPFLASEQGGFTTGAVIDINGGAVSA
ncbi:SDR family oxidoreductase [Gordonia rubripertincta]|uniref:3-oxoacyl-[acyl-carrier-protein] reductase MabA n=1 Tax=Gordonia rubripertincta TaxID=36822 RepID=A0AAW4G735_GORRU|nr:SDR family NAD(P)-dependent oxidoreductase [Gordonia rubripertincta]MBM7279512.1 SDR family oxidoreductase [Gordonia rubripertincta]